MIPRTVRSINLQVSQQIRRDDITALGSALTHVVGRPVTTDLS